MQSGKSTVFSTISGKPLSPTGAVSIQEAIVRVPDERLNWLEKYYNPKKVTCATIDCLDVPGFNFADEHGRAAARRLINQLRTVDLLVLVIRAFEEPSVPLYRNRLSPAEDLEELKSEILLSDLELVNSRIEKLEKQIKKPIKTPADDKTELALYKKLEQTIESEKPVSSAIETEAERTIIKSLGFLTLKPIVIAVNVGEEQLNREFQFGSFIEDAAASMSISAKIEYELAQLDPESKMEFMTNMGIKVSAINKFVKNCYSALGLISFLTVASDEVRAWPVNKGTIAVEAAGKVHSDIKRGFIRAETFSYQDLKESGSEKTLKSAGRIRLEGKSYAVQDGDIINFRFNV